MVLSRKKNAKVVIDLRKFGLGLASIVVVEIRGDKVRLGFEFPADVPVHRMEVFEAIERNGKRDQAKEGEAAA